jgi:NAD(P)-dependent dehydrogenase (short-subunit alcohol dehydrogenase family)
MIEGVTQIYALHDSPKHKWTAADIPSQAGKLAIVTGATSGLGFETALALARAGADIVVAARNERQARWAVSAIRPNAPAALVRYERLDLASLAAIDDFTRRIENLERPVDLLVNNAGVMALPKRQVTVDGFELQFGTNYLGHFALTARLMPLLRRGRDPRVVQVSSVSHRLASIHFDDLQLEQRYSPLKAYSQSKLAMLMFAFELQRKSDVGRWGVLSVAAHPGYARTDLFSKGPGAKSLLHRFHTSVGNIFSHSAKAGALPLLYAATAHKARPGAYYGPKGALELAGPLGVAGIGKQAKDLLAADRLWNVSTDLARISWPLN